MTALTDIAAKVAAEALAELRREGEDMRAEMDGADRLDELVAAAIEHAPAVAAWWSGRLGLMRLGAQHGWLTLLEDQELGPLISIGERRP